MSVRRVLKFSLTGSLLWEFTYDGGSWDGATQVLELDDGTLLVTGSSSGVERYVRITAAGTFDSAFQFAESPGGVGAHMTFAPDGHLLVVGKVGHQIFLRKLAQNGTSLWYRTYGGANHEWACT